LQKSFGVNIVNLLTSLNNLRYGRMKNAVGIYLNIKHPEAEQTGSNTGIWLK